MDAWERADAAGLVALLRDDVRMAMPPSPTWFDGRDAIASFLTGHAFAPGKAAYRLVPTGANRQPAFGVYRVADDGAAKPFAIQAIRVAEGLVADIHFFVYPGLFPAFGLPDSLR
jgi:RNA polymerase sigma-70 factor (ECF subfamily)